MSDIEIRYCLGCNNPIPRVRVSGYKLTVSQYKEKKYCSVACRNADVGKDKASCLICKTDIAPQRLIALRFCKPCREKLTKENRAKANSERRPSDPATVERIIWLLENDSGAWEKLISMCRLSVSTRRTLGDQQFLVRLRRKR